MRKEESQFQATPCIISDAVMCIPTRKDLVSVTIASHPIPNRKVHEKEVILLDGQKVSHAAVRMCRNVIGGGDDFPLQQRNGAKNVYTLRR